MPNLTAGQLATENVEQGHRFTVTTSIDGRAVVQRLYNGAQLEIAELTAGASRTYGEYLADMTFRVSCVAGSVAYLETLSTDQVGIDGGGP